MVKWVTIKSKLTALLTETWFVQGTLKQAFLHSVEPNDDQLQMSSTPTTNTFIHIEASFDSEHFSPICE